MKIERMTWITREDVQANPDKVFLFGDNLERVGMGGQAGAMRGEPNAVGVPTKKAPTMGPDAFFTDDEYDNNCWAIRQALSAAYAHAHVKGQVIVVPADGLGTGLADLENRAPRTFQYLENAIKELEGDEPQDGKTSDG